VVAGYDFPKMGMNVNVFYKLTGKLPYYQTGEVNGKQEVLLMQTGGYHWADLTMNKQLGKMFTLNAGIHNLFNVTRVRSAAVLDNVSTGNTYSSIAYGRSGFIGIIFKWTKH